MLKKKQAKSVTSHVRICNKSLFLFLWYELLYIFNYKVKTLWLNYDLMFIN